MTAPPASEMSEYAFKPFRLTQVNYKRYDGLFDRGIKMYPRPRSGHRIVCNDSDIFCFGGFNPATRSGSHMLFQEFWRFNTFTRKWTLVFGPRDHVSLPAELASHSMCMHGDIVVIFGGTGFPFGTSCSNRVYIIHPYRQPKATITELETIGDVPPPQYGQSILVHDNHLYVVGGTTGFDYTCDIHRLNFKTLVWECVSECRAENEQDPLGRYRHEVVTDADNIYVIGGGTSSTTYPLEHVPTFSLRTGKWRNLETLPDPSAPAPGIPMARKCHSCVHQTNSDGDIEVVIAGGTYEDARFFDDMWLLNLRTMRWRLLHTAVLPHPLHFHDAASSGSGLMYLFGGIEKMESSPARTNNVYKVWVKIPTLSEMCWEAITQMRPRLPLAGKDTLLRAGVPERFARRLNFATSLTASEGSDDLP